MIISSLKLVNFRNYENLEIEFDKKLNVILGENGEGKTNILEAIYLNAFGKSFRTSKDKDLIKFNEKEFYTKINLISKDIEEKIEISLKNGEKSIKVNNNNIKKLSELMNHVHIVNFSPEDLKIVKEDPEKRRRFIDTTLCKLKPGYLSALSNYKRALMQKNILLKFDNPSTEMIELWNFELAKYGEKIMKERYIFIKKLDLISRSINSKISSGKEKLKISYETIKKVDFKEEKIDDLLEKFNEKIDDEIKRRTSLFGPQRDDIFISINGVDVRKFGSQGQQRTAALSLKLAEIELMREEFSEECILLLDDVLSELDENRQKFLIESFKNVQTFITTTEISEGLNNALPYGKRFYIKKGDIEKII